MQNSDLVRMANQIADYYAAYPKSEGIDGIKKHVHSFWEPRMRNHLKVYVDAGGKDLTPLFLEAAQDYFKGPKKPGAPAPSVRASTKPKAAKKPANKGATPSVNRGK